MPKVSLDEEAKIVDKYVTERMSRESIAKLYKISPDRIKIILIKYKIPFRSRSEVNTRFWHKDDSFFERIDTEVKAYWLGFLYADGAISRGKMITVGLSNTDLEHLKKLSLLLLKTDNVKLYPKITTFGNRMVAQLDVMSRKMFNDLRNLGCVERKTHGLSFPTSDQVPEHLIRHFIRGYFDGDGCINLRHNHKTKQANISFVATNTFCQSLQDCLKRLANVKSVVTDLSPATEVIDRVNISSNLDALKMYNFMYSNASVFLDRKKIKFLIFLDSHKDNFYKTGWKSRSWININKEKYSFDPFI